MELILIIISWLNPWNIYKKVKERICGPKLCIYYDSKETYYKAKDLSFEGIEGLFTHVMVKNTGKEKAKNCLGQLINVKRKEDKQYKAIPEYRNIMRLKWAHEKGFVTKDIYPDMPARLDVAYVHRGYDILHFFTEKYPAGTQTDFLPGEYKIKIRVTSDNTKSTDREFIVRYTGGQYESLSISDAI